MSAPLLATGAVESCNNPGRSAFTLLGPVASNRRRFRDDPRMVTGAQVAYTATDGTQTEWGIGTLTIGQSGASDTLSRDLVIENTAGTTATLTFSAAVTVFSAPSSSMLAMKDQAGIVYTGTASDDPLLASSGHSLQSQLLITKSVNLSSGVGSHYGLTQITRTMPARATSWKCTADIGVNLSGGQNNTTDVVAVTFLLSLVSGTDVSAAPIADIAKGMLVGPVFVQGCSVTAYASGLTPGATYSWGLSVNVVATPNAAIQWVVNNVYFHDETI